jgi:hypothetical protein
MRVRYQLQAAALFLLCAMCIAPVGCVSATPEVPAPRSSIETAPPVNLELEFSENNVRKYIATFPGFIRRIHEISVINERDPGSAESRGRILELSKQNEVHVASKGWSGMDGFVEFNGKMVHYLTAYHVLKRFRADVPRYPQAKSQYRAQMTVMEKDLGREGFSVLVKNADRIKLMYRRSGVMEPDGIR